MKKIIDIYTTVFFKDNDILKRIIKEFKLIKDDENYRENNSRHLCINKDCQVYNSYLITQNIAQKVKTVINIDNDKTYPDWYINYIKSNYINKKSVELDIPSIIEQKKEVDGDRFSVDEGFGIKFITDMKISDLKMLSKENCDLSMYYLSDDNHIILSDKQTNKENQVFFGVRPIETFQKLINDIAKSDLQKEITVNCYEDSCLLNGGYSRLEAFDLLGLDSIRTKIMFLYTTQIDKLQPEIKKYITKYNFLPTIINERKSSVGLPGSQLYNIKKYFEEHIEIEKLHLEEKVYQFGLEMHLEYNYCTGDIIKSYYINYPIGKIRRNLIDNTPRHFYTENHIQSLIQDIKKDGITKPFEIAIKPFENKKIIFSCNTFSSKNDVALYLLDDESIIPINVTIKPNDLLQTNKNDIDTFDANVKQFIHTLLELKESSEQLQEKEISVNVFDLLDFVNNTIHIEPLSDLQQKNGMITLDLSKSLRLTSSDEQLLLKNLYNNSKIINIKLKYYESMKINNNVYPKWIQDNLK